jgi:hypothetical protein
VSAACRGRARHWRIAFGTVGMRTPVCVYCGSPNPRPLKDWEWEDLAGWAEDRRVGEYVAAALAARARETSP